VRTACSTGTGYPPTIALLITSCPQVTIPIAPQLKHLSGTVPARGACAANPQRVQRAGDTTMPLSSGTQHPPFSSVLITTPSLNRTVPSISSTAITSHGYDTRASTARCASSSS
jgi:hypothetical protein